MTDGELRGYATGALNMTASEVIENDPGSAWNQLHMVICIVQGGLLRRLRNMEILLAHAFNADWLADPAQKAVFADCMRMVVATSHPECVVTVAGADLYRSTAKLLALPAAEARKLVERMGGKWLARKGYMTQRDGLSAVAQTSRTLCIANLVVGADGPTFEIQPMGNCRGQMRFYPAEK